MDVVAFIPARYGSTRLEGKPLVDIGGKPMVQWVYERALRATLVSEVTVATDDERVLGAVRAFGGKAVMTSPEHPSGTDRVAEAARGVKAGVVVNLQCDEPFIEPDALDAALRPMIDDPGIPLCTLKTRLTDPEELKDPNVVKVVTDRGGYALYFSRGLIPFYAGDAGKHGPRATAAPAKPFKHIGVYAYRRDFLRKFSEIKPTPLELAEGLEQLRALENGFRVKLVETPYNPLSVDTPEDLARARRMFEEETRGGGPGGR
jgi:3-deoxy-manno-octulosonate cytidylyltransferase (CMP-KDO synthetase)